jgi:hypothetical protein
MLNFQNVGTSRQKVALQKWCILFKAATIAEASAKQSDCV